MRLNVKVQYALLFCLYLSRAGRASVTDASANMALSYHMLTAVANKLKRSGVVKSHRGPGGGYELVGDPSVSDVITGVGISLDAIDKPNLNILKVGGPEKRALAALSIAATFATRHFTSMKVRNVMSVLVAKEVEALESVDFKTSASN